VWGSMLGARLRRGCAATVLVGLLVMFAQPAAWAPASTSQDAAGQQTSSADCDAVVDPKSVEADLVDVGPDVDACGAHDALAELPSVETAREDLVELDHSTEPE